MYILLVTLFVVAASAEVKFLDGESKFADQNFARFYNKQNFKDFDQADFTESSGFRGLKPFHFDFDAAPRYYAHHNFRGFGADPAFGFRGLNHQHFNHHHFGFDHHHHEPRFHHGAHFRHFGADKQFEK